MQKKQARVVPPGASAGGKRGGLPRGDSQRTGAARPGGGGGRSAQVGALRTELREYLGAVDAFDDAVARCLGVGRTDLSCLDLLERRGTMSAGQLASACGLSSAAITFALDRLEGAGLVRRRRDTEDRRRVLIELIPSAHRRIFGLHEPMVMDLRALVARYSEHDLETIVDFLRSCRQVYEHHVPAVRRGMGRATGV